jgi:hypothetical protein
MLDRVDHFDCISCPDIRRGHCPLGLHLRSARIRVLSDSNHSLSTGLQPGRRPFEKQTAQVLPLLVPADPFLNILAARASRQEIFMVVEVSA